MKYDGKGISRRAFFKGSMALSIPLLFPSALRSSVTAHAGPGTRLVEVQGALEASLDVLLESLGGIGSFVKPGDTVLIKPNMSFPNPPKNATTTSPRLVRALLLASSSAI